MIPTRQMHPTAPIRAGRLELVEASNALANESTWIGMRVRDRTGHEFGRVDGLLVHQPKGRVLFLRIASGGFLGIGADHCFVPLEATTQVEPNMLRIDQLSGFARRAPQYGPGLFDERAWMEASWRHFGLETTRGPVDAQPIRRQLDG